MQSKHHFLEFYKRYEEYLVGDFLDRYLPFSALDDYIKVQKIHHDIVGYSELGKPIYSIDIGKGNQKILIWSQMHGNESTTTKSIFDVLSFFALEHSDSLVKSILSNCRIKILPMLNPDGASLYTRLNANEVDLNRDAIQKSQAEAQCFFRVVKDFQPDFCFNMHGQRSIFGAGDTGQPAIMSFLAPSYDVDLSINKPRKTAMQLIAGAYDLLQDIIPNQIAKYDDTHNANCFGDYLQREGIPTVLFEAGHFPKDYSRNQTRKLVSLALLRMFDIIANSTVYNFKIDQYFKIPMNKENFVDVIINNIAHEGFHTVALHYLEVLKSNKIEFQPYVKSIGNRHNLNAHRFIDANQAKLKINTSVDFEVGTPIKELEIGGDKLNLCQ